MSTSQPIEQVAMFLIGFNFTQMMNVYLVGSEFALKRFEISASKVSFFVASCHSARSLATLLASVVGNILLLFGEALSDQAKDLWDKAGGIISAFLLVLVAFLQLNCFCSSHGHQYVVRYYWLHVYSGFCIGLLLIYAFKLLGQHEPYFILGLALIGCFVSGLHYTLRKILNFYQLDLNFWLIAIHLFVVFLVAFLNFIVFTAAVAAVSSAAFAAWVLLLILAVLPFLAGSILRSGFVLRAGLLFSAGLMTVAGLLFFAGNMSVTGLLFIAGLVTFIFVGYATLLSVRSGESASASSQPTEDTFAALSVVMFLTILPFLTVLVMLAGLQILAGLLVLTGQVKSTGLLSSFAGTMTFTVRVKDSSSSPGLNKLKLGAQAAWAPIVMAVLGLAFMYVIYPVIAPILTVESSRHHTILLLGLIIEFSSGVIVFLLTLYSDIRYLWKEATASGNTYPRQYFNFLWLFLIPFLGFGMTLLWALHHPNANFAKTLKYSVWGGVMSCLYYFSAKFISNIGYGCVHGHAKEGVGSTNGETIAGYVSTLNVFLANLFLVLFTFLGNAHLSNFFMYTGKLAEGHVFPTASMNGFRSRWFWFSCASSGAWKNFISLFSLDIKEMLLN
ncbi:WWE domain [Babesia duncani]|uniref:WWE domain n=1 Tax=Babesia duncani TaxID=323732 RepID=A0AAD9PMS9_9APIC|nr:WWE domain [Babesia duncani]